MFRPARADAAHAPATAETTTDLADLKTIERDMIQQALVKARFNKSQAAKGSA